MGSKSLIFGLAAVVVGAVLFTARIANADTISVQSLNGPTPSGTHFAWYYNTSLSASGEIKTGDYVEVDTIPGFINTPADNFLQTGFNGTTWNIFYTVATQEVEAIYTGNKGTVAGPVSVAQDLVNLPFLDVSNMRGGGAEWGSDDHASQGNHIGDPETPVDGQFVDAPQFSSSVPVPPSLIEAGVLFALLAGHTLIKARRSIV